MADGREVAARTVIIATGVSWRRLGVASLEALVGTGVVLRRAGAKAGRRTAATSSWSAAGNSAGQAALYLARWAASVTILVRAASLRATMSDYLVREIEKTPSISVRLRTEVVDGSGQGTYRPSPCTTGTAARLRSWEPKPSS
jgi:thioredoxin reductase (NADPH)